MKKFQFSLRKMRDYKEQILDREKNTLQILRSQKDAIDRRIENLEAETLRLEQETHEESSKGIGALQLRCYSFQQENIRMQLKQLRKEQQAAEAAVERQLQVVIAVTQEISGLDKLEEKQLEEYNYALAKADEEFISELVASDFIRKKEA